MLGRFLRARGMTKCLVAACMATAAIGMATKAQASILFNQPGPTTNGSSSFSSESTVGVTTRQQAADDFSFTSPPAPAATAIPLGVEWWGNYDSTGPHTTTFQIRFYSSLSSNGGQGTLIYDKTVAPVQTATGLTVNGTFGTRDLINFKADLPGVVPTLNAGTTYYISILNNWTGSNDHWSWSYLGGAGFYRVGGDTGVWQTQGVDMAFRLYDTRIVPTPSAVGAGLLTLTVMGLAAKARKKKEQI